MLRGGQRHIWNTVLVKKKFESFLVNIVSPYCTICFFRYLIKMQQQPVYMYNPFFMAIPMPMAATVMVPPMVQPMVQQAAAPVPVPQTMVQPMAQPMVQQAAAPVPVPQTKSKKKKKSRVSFSYWGIWFIHIIKCIFVWLLFHIFLCLQVTLQTNIYVFFWSKIIYLFKLRIIIFPI